MTGGYNFTDDAPPQPFLPIVAYWDDYDKAPYAFPHVYDYMEGADAVSREYPQLVGTYNRRRYLTAYGKEQKELLKKVNQKDDYDAIADEILRLRDQRRQAEVDSVIKDEQMKKIRDLQDFVKSQPATITEFDETLVRRLIAKITVFDDHFTVEFKSGITINIEA